MRKIFIVIVYAKTNFIIKIIIITSIVDNSIVVAIISIIVFDIDSFKNVNIDYDYHNWNYDKTIVVLSKIIAWKNDCLNTKFDVILIDRIFWQKQNLNVFVRTMITSLIVRDLRTNQYQIVDYIIVFMYFIDEKNEKSTKIMIRREMHLINNLKINIFIDNNVIDSKRWNINLNKKQIFVENCEIVVSINIQRRSIDQSQHKSIYIIKISIISLDSKMTIFIYYLANAIFNDRDFFFEFDNINFIMYVYLINASIQTILIRNDNFKIVKISRNFRLKYLIEINYSNVFFVDENIVELIMKISRSSHKFSWFKKIIDIFVIVWIITIVISLSTLFDATSSIISIMYTLSLQLFFINFIMSIIFDTSNVSHANFFAKNLKFTMKFFANVSNVVLLNNAIIYFFVDVKIFFKLINEFSLFWKNNEFVVLSKKNWITISLKFDLKKRVFEKTKIYSLKTRDKTLINKIFDELQNLNKLFWTNQSMFFNYSIFCVWKIVNKKRKKRVVINIRELNIITQSNVYFLSL